jgi:hypothetical protein
LRRIRRSRRRRRSQLRRRENLERGGEGMEKWDKEDIKQ